MTLSGIEPATFQFVAQHLNHCATAVPTSYVNIHIYRGTRWRSWLGHCATSRKVADSIPDGVTGNFQSHNPSGRRCGPRVNSASNRNEYQEYILGGKGGRYVGLTTLPPSCGDCL